MARKKATTTPADTHDIVSNLEDPLRKVRYGVRALWCVADSFPDGREMEAEAVNFIADALDTVSTELGRIFEELSHHTWKLKYGDAKPGSPEAHAIAFGHQQRQDDPPPRGGKPTLVTVNGAAS